MQKLLLVLLFCCNLAVAQNFPITWGPLERNNGMLLDILPKKHLDFNTLRWTGGSSFGTYRLVSYDNLTVFNQQKLKLVAETGLCNFVDAFSFGKGTLVFLSDRMKSNMMLYAQFYDEELNALETKLVAEYENQDSTQSQNSPSSPPSTENSSVLSGRKKEEELTTTFMATKS